MSWTVTSELPHYDRAAGEFVHSDPVRNTVMLTVAARVRHQGATAFDDSPPQFGWWTGPDGRVAAVFLRTPPYGILLTALPGTAAADLARTYAAIDPALPYASGPESAVHAFAAAWQHETGAPTIPVRAESLYRLGDLADPEPTTPGAARLAIRPDRPLLIEWLEEFSRQINGPQPSHSDRQTDDRLTHGGLSLWHIDGHPVSLAGTTRRISGTVRIGPVYTPKPFRGKGFAAAITTYVCQSELAAGTKEILLFADRSNPTANALYQRIGFHPIDTQTTVRFDTPAMPHLGI
ncbi:GNAT family N-acetyltransferase [Nocardia sp. NPDC020380]|uniref:GNAT family N-acetyltransferase n=1 Tax=Nocardia sp. NPDC020380 TaxID=3364309 RepID=UPI0037941140